MQISRHGVALENIATTSTQMKVATFIADLSQFVLFSHSPSLRYTDRTTTVLTNQPIDLLKCPFGNSLLKWRLGSGP